MSGGGYLIASKGWILYIHEKKDDILLQTTNHNNIGEKELIDYKIYCFSGKAKFLYISQGLENHQTARINYVTLDWKPAAYCRRDYMEFAQLPSQPKHLKLMILLAEKLASELAFCRVDFYEINERVYFGEITFYPGSGYTPFEKESMDVEIGKMLDLDDIKDVNLQGKI